MLTFSVLNEGDDEDKRVDHLLAEEEKKYDAQEEEAMAAGCPDDAELGGGSGYRQWAAAGMSKEDYKQMLKEEASAKRKAADPLAERTSGKKSGPKGVIADKKWHDFQELKRLDREAAAARDARLRAARGVESDLVDGNPHSISLAATWSTSGPAFESRLEQKKKDEAVKKERSEEQEEEDDGGDDDFGLDDDDEDFLLAYKAKRLEELRGGASGAAAPPPSSTYSSASLSALSSRAAAASAASVEALLPRYDDEDEGWPFEISSQEQFVSTLDAIDKRSFAVVLMWERFVPSAAHLKARVWPALSQMHPHVAFLSAVSSCLSESIDVIGLPAIVIYRGGQTVEAIVRVQDVIGDEKPTADDVTMLLREHGVRPLTMIQPEKGGGGTGAGAGLRR